MIQLKKGERMKKGFIVKRAGALVLSGSMVFGLAQMTAFPTSITAGATSSTLPGVTTQQAETTTQTTAVTTQAPASTTQAAATTQAPTYINNVIEEIVPVTTVECDETLVLEPGETSTFETVVVPLNATYQGMTYSSMDPSIATVDSVGNVTGKKYGTTYITVTSHNGITDQVKVKVNLGQVKKLKKKKVTSNKITLTWKKLSSASGYKVYRYNAKKKKYVLYKTVKKNKIVISKLEPKTTYKFKVRGYKKKTSSQDLGLYSKVITVVTKK